MAADLLPLYLDGCCSADSRAALEAHMDACPACRAQYAQLRRDLTPAAAAAEDPGTDGIARALARKMRRRKRCLRALCAVLGVLLGVLLAVLLVFIGKTFVILGPAGRRCVCRAPGRVRPTLAARGGQRYGRGGRRACVCDRNGAARRLGGCARERCGSGRCARRAKTPWSQRSTQSTGRAIFTNLPPQTLYAVTVDGAPDVQLTVRSRLTFREAFSLMLQEL